MSDLLIPAFVAVIAWWFSTGVILFLDGLPRRTFRWSMLGATVVLAAAFVGLRISGAQPTVAGAYLGFLSSLAIWGWQEMAFLLGFITGPRPYRCPADCRGWRHFGHAVGAILYHELAILLGAVAVVAVTWGQENQVGTWTFLVLWGLRLSAKLNLFLGVRNLNEDWIPEHLDFVKSYLTRRPMNFLFPISITLATVAAVHLVQSATAEQASDFETTGFALLAMLLTLAILEHWLLVLPIDADVLWAWGLRSHRGGTLDHPAGDSERDGPPETRRRRLAGAIDGLRRRGRNGAARRMRIAGVPAGTKARQSNSRAISGRQG